MFGIPNINYADLLLEHGFRDIIVNYDQGLIKGLLERGFNVHIVLSVFRLDKELQDPRFLAEDPLGGNAYGLAQDVRIILKYGTEQLNKFRK